MTRQLGGNLRQGVATGPGVLAAAIGLSLAFGHGGRGALEAQDVRQPGGTPRAAPQSAGPRNPAPRTTPPQNLPPQNFPPRSATLENPAASAPATGTPRGANAVNPLRPDWLGRQPPEELKLVEDILRYWEQKSSSITQYQCDFTRWKYNPVLLPPDPQTGKELPQEVSEGVIKYEAPDKALYRDTKTRIYEAPKAAGQQAQWPEAPAGTGHYWVCDGVSIFEFDAGNKRVLKTLLPPELQGQALATQGPLPFLFRAKSSEIKARYWLKLMQQTATHFVLRAHPKYQADAADYQMIDVFIDRKEFLPEHLVVYNTNYDPRRNPARVTYRFENREINPLEKQPNNPLKLLGIWRRNFIQPDVPRGWQTVEQHVPPSAVDSAQARRPDPPAAAPQTQQGFPSPGAGQRR